MTLKRVTRSIPAIPMADSRPPMVVGIRQTIRAISVEVWSCTPEYSAIGYNVTMTIRKNNGERHQQCVQRDLIGRFCGKRPPTRAIMRSRKLSPGSDVMRTFSQSDTTVVPPVTRAEIAACLAHHRCRIRR